MKVGDLVCTTSGDISTAGLIIETNLLGIRDYNTEYEELSVLRVWWLYNSNNPGAITEEFEDELEILK